MVPLRPPFVALSAALSLGGCVVQFQEQGDYEGAFDLGGRDSVTVVAPDGDREFRGLEDGDVVRIRGTRFAVGSSKDDALDNLEDARLVAREDGESLALVFDPPVDVAGLVDLRIDRLCEVPREAGLSLGVAFGDIDVSDVRGPLDLSTGEGDVSLSGAGGPVFVRTGDGDVEAECSGETEIDARGRIDLEIVEAGDGPVGADSHGRDIMLEIAPQDFWIACYPEGGVLAVDDDLGADVEEKGGGLIVVKRGESGRQVFLDSRGGDITVVALPGE